MDKSLDGSSIQYTSDDDIFEDEHEVPSVNSSSCENSGISSSVQSTLDCDCANLHRTKELFTRVPPPPNITNPQVNLNHALNLLQAYIRNNYHSKRRQDSSASQDTSENNFQDVWENRNIYVQEMETIRPLVQDWFVSNQTSSLLTCKPKKELTESAKKREKTNGWRTSPNSRVDYLKKRVNTFSLCSFKNKRTFDRKNICLKSVPEVKAVKTKVGCPKRALFQSPEKQVSHLSADYSIPSTSSTCSSSSSVSLVNLARNEHKPLRRHQSDQQIVVRRNSTSDHKCLEKKKFWKDLKSEGGEEQEKKKHDLVNTIQVPKLSRLHKEKMYWAIEQTMKKEKVGRTEPEYWHFFYLLFQKSSAIWREKHEGKAKKGSTSDAMLEVATSLLSKVEKESGINLEQIRNRSVTITTSSSSMNVDTSNKSIVSIVPSITSHEEFSSSTHNQDKISCEIKEKTNELSMSQISNTKAKNFNQNTLGNEQSLENQLTRTKSPSLMNFVPDENESKINFAESYSTPDNHSEQDSRKSPKSKIKERTPRSNSKKGVSGNVEGRRMSKRKRNEDPGRNGPTVETKKLCSNETNDDKEEASEKSLGFKDKENDSSVENTYESDTRNWSPVLRLKRKSRNNWTSELKKKPLVEKEETCIESPFLELEGPFEYRLGEGALEGEYIRVVLKGSSYLGAYKKLVKQKEVTTLSILVQPLNDGIQLNVPVSLFERENMALSQHSICHMVGDILEDVIYKMDKIEAAQTPSKGFRGFSQYDIHTSALSSSRLSRVLHLTDNSTPKPHFSLYKHELVIKSPPSGERFYQLLLEIPKINIFSTKSKVDDDRLQVESLKSNSPKKITLELKVPVHFVLSGHLPVNFNNPQDLHQRNFTT